MLILSAISLLALGESTDADVVTEIRDISQSPEISIFNLLINLIGFPLQLINYSTGQSFSLNITYDVSYLWGAIVKIVVSSTGTSVIVLLAMVVSLYLLAKREERKRPIGNQLGIWLQSLLAGLSVAFINQILAYALAIRIYAGARNNTLDTEIYSAGLISFLSLTFIFTLALALGRLNVWQKLLNHPSLRQSVQAVKLFFAHACLLLVFAFGVNFLTFIINALQPDADLKVELGNLFLPVVLAPILLSLLLAKIFLEYHSFNQLGLATSHNLDSSLPLSNPEQAWYILIVMSMAALLCIFIASVLWAKHKKRPSDLLGVIASWISLPAVYFLIGILVLLTANYSVVGELNVFDTTIPGSRENIGQDSFRINAPYYLPFVFGFIGIVIELLSRIFAPILARFMPAALGNTITKAPKQSHAAQINPSHAAQTNPSHAAQTNPSHPGPLAPR